MTSIEDQRRILTSCHSDPTSGHFGITKTWIRVAERFYWRGMSEEVKELVSSVTMKLSVSLSSVGKVLPCLSAYEQKADN